jgi:crossover junction endodeoxyribonuclease RuvC
MGYGLVEEKANGVVSAVAWGVLVGKSHLSLGERLHHLYGDLLTIVEQYAPVEAAVEEPFVSVNARTAMAVGQAQGLALMAAAARGISIAHYSPRQVKQAVSGHGGASKEQVKQAVAMHLGLDAQDVPEDAADALAVALCHLQSRRVAALIAQEP